jgi:glyoxylase-like metal-dependent hydrolase (beta-lactamase superfamily II)
LIDTGENSKAAEPGFFACDSTTGRVYPSILRPQVSPEEEIGPLLKEIGILPEDIRWVVLTHLHSDHIDGAYHFPKSEFMLSRTEHNRPYGAVTCVLPDWFKPNLISPQSDFSEMFPQAHPLTRSEDVWILPTPGHSYGHQSVLLRLSEVDILFAGDTTFIQKQLLDNRVGGINADITMSRKTNAGIRRHMQLHPTVYLSSHDPESAARLLTLDTVNPS